MKMLTVETVSKSYAEKVLFRDISFTIREHDRIGIIGVNGTGKSTLLKIVAGVELADAGQISHSKDYTIGHLPQKPVFYEELTVLEQVFSGDTPLIRLLKEYEWVLAQLEEDPLDEKTQERLYQIQQQMDAMNAWEASSSAKAILTKLGVLNLTQKVGELSGGQKRRVALAQALIETPDLLVLDEPTNHLDYKAIRWLEDYLSRYNGAVLFVTHDRYFLDRVSSRIFELDGGTIYDYKGNYAQFLEAKALREEQELALEEKRQNLYRKELAWIKRGAKARTTKQKARIQRFEQLEASLGIEQRQNVEIALGGSRLGKKVIDLKNVCKQLGGQLLLDNFSFLIKPGDRIGIVGSNGSGKSTLLNLLAGRLHPDSGEIETGQTVKIAYYTQESVDMDENKRMIEYIREAGEIVRTTDGKAISASQILERFLFPVSMHGTPIRKLSGGEKRRLYLLRLLMLEPNVLLLDEPTNDLDTQTLTVLENYLETFPWVVITVSHDRYFLDKVTEQLLIFEGNGQIKQYYGDYSDYLEEQAKLKEEEKEQNVNSSKEKKQDIKPKKRRLSYKEQKEWEEIEEKITNLEEKLLAITSEMEDAASDYEKVQALALEHDQLSAELERLLDRWTELSELVESLQA